MSEVGPNEEEQRIRQRIQEAVTDIVAGTAWAPPEGGVLVDVVTCLGWVTPDGATGSSWIGAGKGWATEGLLRQMLRAIENQDRKELEDGGDGP